MNGSSIDVMSGCLVVVDNPRDEDEFSIIEDSRFVLYVSYFEEDVDVSVEIEKDDGCVVDVF